MKAEELRIGNWYKDRWDYPFQVDSITKKGINVSATDDGKPYGMHSAELAHDHLFDEAFGIELTEEWLLKFSFVFKGGKLGAYCFDTGKGHYFLGRWNDIKNELVSFGVAYDDEPNNHYFFTWNIKFVHQLQNLYFALTGLELTIKE